MLAVGVVGIVAIAWLVLALLSPISLPFQKVEATMTPQVQVVDGTAQVTGTTTLPDGAVLYYSFAHESLALEDAGGSARVQDGRFSFAKDLSAWPTGSVTLYLEFSIANYGGDEQPADVVAIFGSQGEHLDGPQGMWPRRATPRNCSQPWTSRSATIRCREDPRRRTTGAPSESCRRRPARTRLEPRPWPP